MDYIISIYRRLIAATETHSVRSLESKITWDLRLIGIKGARGVGKTTMILQHIKLKHGQHLDACLYVSLDLVWFGTHTLVDLADDFAKQGGRYLFLDEVHKYPNWSQELKNIYDSYPELKVVFTGSSLLELLNARADLSRRAKVYTLQGLSFREYINFETGLNLGRFKLNEVLNQHVEISRNILEKVRPLSYFDSYLRLGYYPFYRDDVEGYHQRIEEVISMILEIELPLLRGTELSNVSKMKALLAIIAESVPFIPNISKLSERMGIGRVTLLQYFYYLEEAGLLINLYKDIHGIASLQKPRKVFLENSNLMYALSYEGTNKGNVRESFFANQLKKDHELQYSDRGDFLVNSRYFFEIGGKDKSSKQIEGMENAFIAADGIEYGFGNKIPLWQFGFLY